MVNGGWDPEAKTEVSDEGELKLELDYGPAAGQSAPQPAIVPSAPLYDLRSGASRNKPQVGSADSFSCPRCSAPQPKGDSCSRCGVVFAKVGRNSSREGKPAGAPPGVPVVRGEPSPDSPAAPPRPPSGQTGFWPSLGESLIVPFRGTGVLWIPFFLCVLIGGAVFGGRLGLLLKLSYVGLLATYFANAVSSGIDGAGRAPALHRPQNLREQLIYPGIALIGLTCCLWGPPLYLAVAGAFETPAADFEQAAEGEGAPSFVAEILPWDPGELFRSSTGALVTFHAGDPPELAQRADGRWVRVHPTPADEDEDEGGYVELLPVGFVPGAALFEEPVGGQGEETALSFAAMFVATKLSMGRTLLVLLLIAFAFYYWPMALAVGAYGGNVLHAFNPFKVLSRAYLGGLEYVTVAWMGALLPFGVVLVAAQLSFSLLIVVLLATLGYLAGVQGYLLGRLIAVRPAVMPEAGQ